ncbi:band 7 [Chlorella sorokiniana]|uniref:Band 7 n=1 Tax=Chlorella sorokiniana TaxID=3076 RepID=A0A2P6TQ10_CHLSO|nr:band 7 [Chlorella sorokiniana]|eukprot:PRW56123.1 band 7 [Chlorella sorokiniana]
MARGRLVLLLAMALMRCTAGQFESDDSDLTDLEEGLLGDDALLLLSPPPLAPAPEMALLAPPSPPPPAPLFPPPKPPASPPPPPRVVTQPVHNVTADPIKPYPGQLLPAARSLDWTLAGYREGRWSVPTAGITYNVKAFGAKGDGQTDDTAVLQRVVDAANRSPGVVFFPAGIYLLSRPVTVTRGRVVLRGAGADKTFIHITRALGDVFPGTWREGGESKWNSGGGFINFAGARQRSDNGATLLATISGPVAIGSNIIPVKSAARLKVGQRIRIYINDRSTWGTRRRRQLLARQHASSDTGVPEWVASDPVWQVAQAAAAAGMSEHVASTSSGMSSGEGDDSLQTAETAALWANFTASGGSLLPSWSLGDDAATSSGSGSGSSSSSSASGGNATAGGAIGVRSLDLSTAEDESSYEDARLPDPPAYDGSDGRRDARHRSAVTAANYSTSGSGWEEAADGSGAAGASGGTAARPGGRRLADSYFSGPAAGTILSWMYGEGLVDIGSDENGVVDTDEIVMSATVAGIRNGQLILDRGLPFPVKTLQGWQGRVHLDWPTMEDAGVEAMTIRFAHSLMEEHHNARGRNAIQMAYAANVWVRNVRIINADSGIFLSWVHRSSIQDVVLGVTSSRVSPSHSNALNGHHGIALNQAQTVLVRRVGVTAPFIHDLTVSSSSSMNVFVDCAGFNLNLDHHRTAPFSNLFTNLNHGYGTRAWASGGRSDRGAHSGRNNVYWGLRAANGHSLAMPACDFGPYLSFVGNYAGGQCPKFGWLVTYLNGKPASLYEAQRRKLRRTVAG